MRVYKYRLTNPNQVIARNTVSCIALKKKPRTVASSFGLFLLLGTFSGLFQPKHLGTKHCQLVLCQPWNWESGIVFVHETIKKIENRQIHKMAAATLHL